MTGIPMMMASPSRQGLSLVFEVRAANSHALPSAGLTISFEKLRRQEACRLGGTFVSFERRDFTEIQGRPRSFFPRFVQNY